MFTSIRFHRVLVGFFSVLAFGALASEVLAQAARSSSGRIVGSDGSPIAGAKVTLVNNTALQGPLVAATTTTDADGRFRFTSDLERPTALVQADGYGMAAVSLTSLEGEDVPDTRLDPGATLKVRFTAPDGTPASGARISFHMIGGVRIGMATVFIPDELAQSLARTTDANGDCVFPGLPQEATVRLGLLDDRYAQSPRVLQLTLGAGAETNGGVIQLASAATVTGVVLYGDTQMPVPGVRVSAQGVRTSGNPGGASATTDQNGRYTLKQLLGGEYNIALDDKAEWGRRYAAAAHERVAVTTGQLKSDIDFKLVSGGLISGRVLVKGSDEPVPNLLIGVYGPAHPRSGAWVQNTRTAADGSYTLRVPPGPQYVYIQDNPPLGLNIVGQRSRDIVVEADQTVRLDYELEASPHPPLRGRVVDAAGNGAGGATVTVELTGVAMLGGMPVQADAEGRFSIRAIANGSRLSATRGRSASLAATVVGDDRDITLVISRNDPASVRVRVVQSDDTVVKGAEVQLITRSGSMGIGSGTVTTDNDGAVIIKSLSPATEYSVSVTAPGFGVGQANLNPEPGRQVDVRVVLPKADSFIAGTVVDTDGRPVPFAQVEFSGGRSGNQTTRSDLRGQFRMENVVPGDTLLVYVRIETGDRRPGVPTRVRAGTTDATIVFQPAPDSRRGQ